jgi:hypothetical protein
MATEDLTRVFTSDDREWVPVPLIPKGEAWIKVIRVASHAQCPRAPGKVRASLAPTPTGSFKRPVPLRALALELRLEPAREGLMSRIRGAEVLQRQTATLVQRRAECVPGERQIRQRHRSRTGIAPFPAVELGPQVARVRHREERIRQRLGVHDGTTICRGA